MLCFMHCITGESPQGGWDILKPDIQHWPCACSEFSIHLESIARWCQRSMLAKVKALAVALVGLIVLGVSCVESNSEGTIHYIIECHSIFLL